MSPVSGPLSSTDDLTRATAADLAASIASGVPVSPTIRGWKAETNCLTIAGVSRVGSTVTNTGTIRAASAGSLPSSIFMAAPIVCMSVGQTSGQKV